MNIIPFLFILIQSIMHIDVLCRLLWQESTIFYQRIVNYYEGHPGLLTVERWSSNHLHWVFDRALDTPFPTTMHLQSILCSPVDNEKHVKEAGTTTRQSKSASMESPTQYYLNELGLDLDWQNNLLQFGQLVTTLRNDFLCP